MGKKWQALLLGQKPAAMVTVKHKHANNAAVFAFDAFRKVLIDANSPVTSETGTGKKNAINCKT